MKKTLLMLLLGGLSPVLAASEQQFAFALPELEGRISLGVFNESKQLVRTLRVQATEADFTVGINGLITTWDGKNDAGQDQPTGKYFVRGYVVGNAVKSEGIDFHFNDWIESEKSPPLQSPRLLQASVGNLFLLGLNGLLCRFSDQDGLQNIQALPATPLVEDTFRYQTSEKNFSYARTSDVPAYATWQEKFYLAPTYGSPIHSLRVLTFASQPVDQGEIKDSPPGLSLLDANRAALVASDRQHVWIYRGKTFDQVPFAEDLSIQSLSAGLGDTFWIVGQTTTAGLKSSPFVRQYSFLGELLRQLACDTAATTIFADKEQERIFLTQSPDPSTTTIKGLRPLPSAGASSGGKQKVVDWEIFIEKTSTLCRQFGLVDGHLVADAGKTPQGDTRRIDLAASLESARQSLDVQVRTTAGEIWLQTSDGLRLMPVGLLEGGERCVVAPAEQANGLKVYVGNGAVVAEYLLSGLDQIAEIDAGEIDLP